MNKIANRQVICEVLLEHAAKDRDITVLCSDSRGSASLAPFAEAVAGTSTLPRKSVSTLVMLTT